jgi:regulatory protein
MSLEVKAGKEDHRSLQVYWDGALIRTVNRALFARDLKVLARSQTRIAFEEAFRSLEEKIAKREVLKLLERRGHLSAELRRKLVAKGLSDSSIESALAFGKRGGCIDDDHQLKQIVRQEQSKGRGPQAILARLRQKMASAEQIRQLQAEIYREEKRSLEELIRKRYAKFDRKDPKTRQKIAAQLYRRGFSLEAIKTEWGV